MIGGAILLLCSLTAAQEKLDSFNQLKNVSLLVTDTAGQPLHSANAERGLIPASTTKLLTTWLALQHWGEEHRFTTEFIIEEDTKTLWIKAGGDPFLISEELNVIAQRIRSSGVRSINRIALDVSLFETNLIVPGATTTNNPYDAIPSALAANFNTLNLKRIGAQVYSAEEQTPLTAFALSFADQIKDETLRINTGQNSKDAERHFAELLAAFLRQHDIEVADKVVWEQTPTTGAVLIHHNTRPLGEILTLMLKYSTNFIANQILLTLVSEVYSLPGNFALVNRYSEEAFSKRFNWNNFALFEGAGLSRMNRLSARQLMDVLQALKPWKHLLPEIEPGVHAKTGTLDGVSTLAGYLISESNLEQLRPFVILINETVKSNFTRELALELLDNS